MSESARAKPYSRAWWKWYERVLDEDVERARQIAAILGAPFWSEAMKAFKRRRRRAEKAAAKIEAEHIDLTLKQRADEREFELLVESLVPGVTEYCE